jgi:hypothetical protein
MKGVQVAGCSLIQADAKDRIALLRLAEVHLQMKETAKSEEIVKNLLVKNASDPEARYLRGKIYLACRGPGQGAG